MSQWLTQKEPVRYTNRLIKKTTGTNYREYLQLTKKSNTMFTLLLSFYCIMRDPMQL